MERISVDSNICHGKPCIIGTRIMVAQVLDLLEAGRSQDEVVADYFPDITLEDVRACLRFARQLVENEEIHLVQKSAAA